MIFFFFFSLYHQNHINCSTQNSQKRLSTIPTTEQRDRGVIPAFRTNKWILLRPLLQGGCWLSEMSLPPVPTAMGGDTESSMPGHPWDTHPAYQASPNTHPVPALSPCPVPSIITSQDPSEVYWASFLGFAFLSFLSVTLQHIK